MVVRNYNGQFSKPIRQVHKNAGIYSQNPVSKSKAKAVNAVFCEEKQKVSLLVYHLEGLCVPLLVRVPQFGNHWRKV